MKKFLIALFIFLPTVVFAATSYRGYDSLPDAKPTTDGELVFQEMGCTLCHGFQGMGDGFLAEGLDPKPRNFTSYEQMVRLPDLQMEMSIRKGKVGSAMPAFPQLSDKQVQDVIAYIRSLLADSYMTINMCVNEAYDIDAKKGRDFRVEVDDPKKLQAKKVGSHIQIKAKNWYKLLEKKVSRSHVRVIEKNKTISLIAVRFHNCVKDTEAEETGEMQDQTK